MHTFPKTNKRIKLFSAIFAVAMVYAGFGAALVPAPPVYLSGTGMVYAQAPPAPAPRAPAAGTPQCAVAGYGLIACPPNAGVDPQSSKCYVQDPAAPKPEDRSRFVEKACGSAEFKKAATPPTAIDCSKTSTGGGAPPREYCDPAFNCTGDTCDLVKKYVNPLIKTLAALVGVGVTISIIMAGIQYASSANDPQAVTAAKHRIFNSILTLIGFFLFFAFLNWIIPGGLGI